MKLARKYEIESIRKCGTDIMKESWPQSFDQWRRFNAEAALVAEAAKDDDNAYIEGDGQQHAKPLDDRLPEPAAAIRLGHDCDVPAILPAAYYALVGRSVKVDWNNFRAEHDAVFGPSIRTVRWHLLDAADMRRLQRGREVLATSVDCIVASYSSIADLKTAAIHQSCVKPSECHKQLGIMMKNWRNTIFHDLLRKAVHPDPLGLGEQLYDSRPSWGICYECADQLQGDMSFRQSCMWASLPEAFGLEFPWCKSSLL